MAQSGPTPDTSPPTVIIDGDVGPDPCDFANLAMAHSLDASGDIEVLGYMSTMPEPSNIAVLDIMNRWYGHDFPLAMFPAHTDEGYQRFVVPSSEFVHQIYPASRDIAARYASWDPQTPAETPSSTALYRELLAAEPDRSITVYPHGQLYNIKALLDSGPDEHSPLSGAELVEAKVERMVMMIGAFGEPMTLKDLEFYNNAYQSDPPNAYGVTTGSMR